MLTKIATFNFCRQPCNTSAQCDPGGEGCVNKGTMTKRYGPANCNVPHTRTRAETCLEAGGTLSHPTATTWLCSKSDKLRVSLRPEIWPANSTVQIWLRNLSKGDIAVAVYNNGAEAGMYSMRWMQLPGVTNAPQSCRDLWAKTPHAVSDGLSGKVRGWQCLLYRCTM